MMSQKQKEVAHIDLQVLQPFVVLVDPDVWTDFRRRR